MRLCCKKTERGLGNSLESLTLKRVKQDTTAWSDRFEKSNKKVENKNDSIKHTPKYKPLKNKTKLTSEEDFVSSSTNFCSKATRNSFGFRRTWERQNENNPLSMLCCREGLFCCGFTELYKDFKVQSSLTLAKMSRSGGTGYMFSRA